MDNIFREKFWFLLLFIVLLFSLWRVVGFAYQFSQESLQMDFAAFYTAGEARQLGVSPYVNHLDKEPPIWDGAALLRHSRFLYPPLTARLFQPLSWLSYKWAKGIWTVLILVCVGGAVYLVWKSLPVTLTRIQVLIWAIGICLFHPVLTVIERGQIDAITFLLLVVCVVWMQKNKKWQLMGGGSLALAVFFKLHCFYLVPFLVLRKQWFTLIGFVGCFLLGVLVSIGLDGYALNKEYVFEHVPRIAQYGEGGRPTDMMPRPVLEPYLENLRAGYTLKDGVRYRQVGFDFVASATWVDFFAPSYPGASSNSSGVSLGLFVVCFGGIVLWRFVKPDLFSGTDRVFDWLYWQLTLVIILLCAPTTWVMNLVWVLPVLGLLMVLYQYIDASYVWPLCLAGLGVLVAGIPDHYSMQVLLPYLETALEFKYVLAEGLLVGALVWLLSIYKVPDVRP